MTHYDVHNHGAHLQLYALKQVLSGLGFDAAALQYNKNYDFMDKNAALFGCCRGAQEKQTFLCLYRRIDKSIFL